MNDAPDFISSARHLLKDAETHGATFHPDGTWTMNAGRQPLPAGLADRLRVHRKAIVMVVKPSE
jgi:hypothetical protein